MVASDILIQPNADLAINNGLVTSYRQIRFEVLADSAVPSNQPMYCDVYNNVLGFFQTLISYTIITDPVSGHSVFVFDIQDVMQRIINILLPDLSFGYFTLAGHSVQSDATIGVQNIYTICYFRGSVINADGTITPQAPAPVQGTATTPPISTYTGLACNGFNVLQSTIMPVFTSIFLNLADPLAGGLLERLEYYTQRRLVPELPDNEVYPLSSIPKINSFPFYPNTFDKMDLCPVRYSTEAGGMPILIMSFGTSGALSLYSRNCTIYVSYTINGVIQPAVALNNTDISPELLTNGCWYIEAGLYEIFQTNPALKPIFCNAVNNVCYSIMVWDVDSANVAFVSPWFRALQTPNNDSNNIRTLWFQNAFGHFEQMSFLRSQVDLNVSSASQLIPYTETGSEFEGTANNYLAVGNRRYNIRASDEITLTQLFSEQLMDWLRELLISPKIYMRVADIRTHPPSSVTQYLLQQVTIEDTKIVTKYDKVSGGKKYKTVIKIRPSIDYIAVRN